MGGLKSIELQVALPKTQTAGKLQDQLQQRNAVVQGHLAQKQLDEQVQKKNRISEAEVTTKNRLIRDEEQKEGRGKNSETNNHKKITKDDKDLESKEDHPYKGKHFDVKW